MNTRFASRPSIPCRSRLGIAALAVVTLAVPPSVARAEASCRNSCVTMAIPAAEGVETRLDGSADAVLWPPSRELRTIRLSALNDHARKCDVTIRDVRQDETPSHTSSGASIDDATNCHNEGDASSVDLRSEREPDGDGRAYAIRFELEDPDCSTAAKSDEVLVMVPPDPNAMSLKPDVDEESMITSYAGPALECTPASDDRVSLR